MGNLVARLCNDADEDHSEDRGRHDPLLANADAATTSSMSTVTRSSGAHKRSESMVVDGGGNRTTSKSAVGSQSTGTNARRNTTAIRPQSSNGAASFYYGSAAKSLLDLELMAFIGQGSFAEVTLARHRTTHELFAIKKISKKKVKEEGSVERAFTERQILASLKHPFLVRLHQAFQSPTHLYLVLEFAPGGDFRSLLQRRQSGHHDPRAAAVNGGGHLDMDALPREAVSSPSNAAHHRSQSAQVIPTSPTPPHHGLQQEKRQGPADGRLPLDCVFFYAAEVALALLFLHGRGFVYRDLKPENILLRRDGHVMLTDFGVAKRVAASRATHSPSSGDGASNSGPHFPAEALHHLSDTRHGASNRTHSYAGTQEYMSPEMLQGLSHGPSTDWWSFGCWMFEMVNGRHPFMLLASGNRAIGGGHEVVVNEYALFQRILEEDVMLDERFDFALQQTQLTARDDTNDDESVKVTALCHARDLILSLLRKNPADRLGDANVLRHPFFGMSCWASCFEALAPEATVSQAKTLDGESRSTGLPAAWEAAFLECRLKAPLQPELSGSDDLRCFPFAVRSVAAVAHHKHSRSATPPSLMFQSGGLSPANGTASILSPPLTSPKSQKRHCVPSHELFAYMLQIEEVGGNITAPIASISDNPPGNDEGDDPSSLRSSVEGQSSPSRPSSVTHHVTYYEEAALPSDVLELHSAPEVPTLPLEREGFIRQRDDKDDSEVGSRFTLVNSDGWAVVTDRRGRDSESALMWEGYTYQHFAQDNSVRPSSLRLDNHPESQPEGVPLHGAASAVGGDGDEEREASALDDDGSGPPPNVSVVTAAYHEKRTSGPCGWNDPWNGSDGGTEEAPASLRLQHQNAHVDPSSSWNSPRSEVGNCGNLYGGRRGSCEDSARSPSERNAFLGFTYDSNADAGGASFLKA